MDANYTDMLKCLNGAGVDYILVGGWAVNMYGYKRAVSKEIDGIAVKVISIEDLIANKKASGRTKDLADVEVLERIGK